MRQTRIYKKPHTHFWVVTAYWRLRTVEHMYSRRFTDDNCPLQLIKKPKRKGPRLNNLLSNKELMRNVEPKGRLSCSDHETVEIEILGATRRVESKITTLDFRRGEFGLLEDLSSRIPWDRALSVEGWMTFKDCFLKAQD